jgi:precorrin-2 dehydrogenase / sirohydrochlorin ferrochelatase
VSGVPILVEGAALEVLIVGGGAVAVRKASAFAAAGAALRIVAREPSEAMQALAKAPSVRLETRDYEAHDIGDATLVIAATDDRATNARVAADARAAARLVNVVDAPEGGSFATMATHRSGALVMAVSAGGVPGAAARVRDELAGRFGDRYALALADLAALRRSLLDRGQGAQWRALASAVIDEGFCDAVESGTLEARMGTWR